MNAKLAVSLAILSAPLLAQGHLTTPPTGTDREGPDATFIFGWAAEQGHRFMDNNHVGTARALKGVSFRLDSRDHDAIGRIWSKVTVTIAHGDWSSIQYNKSNAFRLIDAPVVVFDKSWSFPTLKGKPPLEPASWGGPQSSLSFRFSRPWAYNGKDAIYLEFRFSGGRAVDNRPWIGGAPKGFEYYLDSMPESMWRGQGGAQSFPAKPAPCSDSVFAGKLSAGLKVSLSTRGGVDLSIESYYTAPTRPVVHAIGIAGDRNGVDVGAGCNLLYLDVSQPSVFLALPAPNDKIGYARTAMRTGPMPSLREVWVQAAWPDSKTGQLKLTHALLAKPGGIGIVPAATSYTTGGPFNVWTSAAKGMPYMRYDY